MGDSPAISDANFQHVRAAARILGVDVHLRAGTDWSVDGHTLTVGTDYFLQAGHPSPEAEALTLVTLWRLIQVPVKEPIVSARRNRIGLTHPHLEPLLAGIDIVCAAVGTVAAFPAVSDRVASALSRLLLAEQGTVATEALPRHVQFVACLIDRVCGSTSLDFLPEVTAELTAESDLLPPLVEIVARVVSSCATEFDGWSTWEVLFSVLREPYLKLLSKDLSDRGLTLDAVAVPATDANDSKDANAGVGEAHRDAETEAEDVVDQRAASDKEQSEGADLFASEQTAFVHRILPQPLPTHEVTAARLEHTAATHDVQAAAREANLTVTGQSPGLESQVGSNAYEFKAHKYAREIDELRDTWMRLMSSQLRPRRRRSAWSVPEGVELQTEMLAQTIAQTRAGVRRPAAFVEPQIKLKRQDNIAHRDYVFLIDRSASMQGPTAELTADAVLILLEALTGLARDLADLQGSVDADLGLGIRSALVLFDEQCEVVKPLSAGLTMQVRRELHEKIQQPQGATMDGAALAKAREILVSSPVPGGQERRKSHVVIVGDGGTHDSTRAQQELAILRASDVAVTAVGVGHAGEIMVNRFAPDGFWVPYPKDLPQVFERIISSQVATQ